MRLVVCVAVLCCMSSPVFVAAQNKDYNPDPKWKAPPSDAAKKNPFAGNASAARKGHELFEAQCSMCHGMDGRGLANAANFHKESVQRESDGTLFWKITNGNQNKGMPPFKHLSEDERWQLVTYLRTLRDNPGAKRDE